MGIPDFLKFVARSSPRALCRISHSGTHSSILQFDYILVDATNVDQTIGIDSLLEFLKLPTISVRKAVIFALDSQRSREGTVRHHRQSHTMIGDLDVRVQRICIRLNEHYRSQFEGGVGEARQSSNPLVLISGRSVAGEADYKILDLHRTITAAHLLVQEHSLPSFLIISEDSDILCGALCGPAPHTIGIATNLRSTTFELYILRVEHVLEYIADCVEAFKIDNDPVPETMGGANLEQTACVQPVREAGAKIQDTPLMNHHEEETTRKDEDDVFRRRKKDGPNVATGVRIEFSHSSSDDEEDAEGNASMANAPGPRAAAPALRSEDATAPMRDSHNNVSLSKFCKEAGYILETTCVDLVFLFVLIMGNGANVPPLGRGVTKVDIASCWQAYCHKKYLSMAPEEKVMGRTLLDCGSSASGLPVPLMEDTRSESLHLVSMSLDCSYLYSILKSVHYADDQSRSPIEEEKSAARVFLSNVVYVTLRYIIGCNLEGGTMLTETFLDSRPLLETESTTPNLAAVLWVLGQQQRLSFQFLLSGSGLKNLSKDSASDTYHPVGVVRTEGKGTNSSSSLQLDVRENLVSPAPASSWAVRKAGSRNYFMKVATSNRNHPILFSTLPSEDSRGISVASLVLQYAAHRADPVAETDRKQKTHMPVFSALITTWRRSVMMAIPHLQKLFSASTRTASDPPAKHIGLSLNYSSPGASGTNPSAATCEPASHHKSNDTHAAEGVDLVYSFELRRMVPVLCSTSSHHNQLGNDVKELPSSSSENQATLRSVLGISLDYTRQDLNLSAPKSEPILPRTPRRRDDGDHAEHTRVHKVSRKEKNKGDLPEQKSKAPKTQKKLSPSSVPFAKKSQTRPGKKERKKMTQKRQVTNAEK